eukprot:165963_1
MSVTLLEHQHCIGPVCLSHSIDPSITIENVDSKLQEVKQSIESIEKELDEYNTKSSAITNHEQKLLLHLPNECLATIAIDCCKKWDETADSFSNVNTKNTIDNNHLKQFIKSLSNDYYKIKQQYNKQNDKPLNKGLLTILENKAKRAE